ncbi:MAG TPA: M15 family metallopeptidase [Clostridiales bacterium]|nr:M15 family metallopeptidase [Clostridiales bacterium]
MNKKRVHKGLIIAVVLVTVLLSAGLFFLFGDLHSENGVLFVNIKKSQGDIHSGDLVLVNYENEYDFSHSPKIVSLKSKKNSAYSLRNGNEKLEKDTVKALNKMLKKFKRETGIGTVCVNSAYRTYDEQATIFENRINEYGYDGASVLASEAGFSEHHTGLACDLILLNDDGTTAAIGSISEYTWFTENADDYGFIIRYPEGKTHITKISNEPWHFRYIGKAHAKVVSEYGFCLEEYIDYIKDYSHKSPLVCDGYSIYYCEGTKVTVPIFKSYTISGNNIDGFVISYKN